MPKCVQFLNLVSLDDVHVCAQNGRMFGRRLSFSSWVHLPRCFICSFGCCLEKPRPPLACCISGFFPFWSYEILCGFFLPLLFLIPGCLHTSLGLRLACWTISKPGGGHDVVILWFVNCFVMDCLNSRLIKYWQLWQNARCSFFSFVWVCTNAADENECHLQTYKNTTLGTILLTASSA